MLTEKQMHDLETEKSQRIAALIGWFSDATRQGIWFSTAEVVEMTGLECAGDLLHEIGQVDDKRYPLKKKGLTKAAGSYCQTEYYYTINEEWLRFVVQHQKDLSRWAQKNRWFRGTEPSLGDVKFYEEFVLSQREVELI